VLNSRHEPDPLDALSARERDVLALLVEGMPNKLIARRLAISDKTVKSHLTRIFRVLDVTDRTQAALWAERHGMRPKSH
jgi:DNA-binding NarL/FixJ family response regulator